MSERHEVLVAHDTTEFSFSSPREGTGRLTKGGHGCYSHFSLAVGPEALHEVLGVLSCQTHTRTKERKKKAHCQQRPEESREFKRWWQGIEKAEASLPPGVRGIHGCDREGDSFLLLTRLKRRNLGFVLRARCNRWLVVEGDEPKEKLYPTLEKMTATVTRTVVVSARKGRKPSRRRERRTATLEAAAGSVKLRRPVQPEVSDEELPPFLEVNVVHVRELNLPDDVEPVDWKLITSEPIATPVDIERVIDLYRARWRIEEFFHALKSGCAIEKRQLESLPAILNAVGLFCPVAVDLLRLRGLAREDATASPSAVLNPVQIQILELKAKLKPKALVYEAMLAVARLGGHLKQNGDPGWTVLGRGYQKLLTLEAGARLAHRLQL